MSRKRHAIERRNAGVRGPRSSAGSSRRAPRWTEARKDENDPKSFRIQRDVKKLWTAPADDVLLVKVVYWLGR